MEVTYMARKKSKVKDKKFIRNKETPDERSGSEEQDKEKGKEKSASEAKENKGLRSPTNDPAWYGRYPELLRDSSVLMYSNPFGAKYKLISKGANISTSAFKVRDNSGSLVSANFNANADNNTAATPGLVSLYLWPTLGLVENRDDPVNQMVNQLYTQVRYMNSGRKNYDPADLTIYVLAIEELYSFIQWCKRLYGFAFVYSQQNMYVGEAMLRANGVDPEDFKNNLNDFRGWLNSFILHTSSYCIPKDMAYIQKKLFQYLGIYMENPYGNIKDQIYEFVPGGFLTFRLDSNGAGKLELLPLKDNPADQFGFPRIVNVNSNLMSVADVIKYGNILFNKISFDEDFSLMSGDILKAYGANGIVVLDVQGEEGGILPVYDPLVLSQFKNASVNGTLNRDVDGTSRVEIIANSGIYAGDVGQDANGNLVSVNVIPRPNASTTSTLTDYDFMHNGLGHILTVENPAPGPDDNMEASRLITSGVPVDGIIGDTRKIYCGTEICYNASVLVRKNNSWVTFNFDSNVGALGDYFNVPGLATALTAYLMSCKYAPRFMLIALDAQNEIAEFIIDQNVDQYTVISWQEVQKMHRCALFSLLAVPTVARNINA